MLLSLLPGVRDIRSPLSAGTIWLIAGYLALAPHVPDSGHSSGALATVYGLAGYVGKGSVVAATLFVAYLVGILQPAWLTSDRLWASPYRFMQWVQEKRRDRRLRRNPGPHTYVRRPANLTVSRALGLRTAVELTQRVENLARQIETPDAREAVLETVFGGPIQTERPGPIRADEFTVGLLEQLLEEQPALAEKLRIQDKERLWLAYDQKTSEGDFRKTISTPILALIIALTALGWWWSALAIPIPFLLYRQGEAKERESRSELYQALLNGVIKSQILIALADAVGGTVRTSQRSIR